MSPSREARGLPAEPGWSEIRHADREGSTVVVQYQLAHDDPGPIVELRIDHPAFPFVILAGFAGRRLRHLAFLSLDEHDGLLPRQLQRMPLRRLLDAQRRAVLAASGWDHEGAPANPIRETAGVVEQARRNGAAEPRGRRPRGAEFDQLLRDTAEHYRAAQDLRGPTESVVAYVARHINKSEDRTRKLIGLARAKHHLGPARRGVAGETTAPTKELG